MQHPPANILASLILNGSLGCTQESRIQLLKLTMMQILETGNDASDRTVLTS